MIKKILILFLLLIPMAFADLSDYPEPFVVDHYSSNFADVMGTNYVGKHSVVAAEIIYSLRPVNGNFITRLDTEMLNNYKDYNLLLIGDPCQNKITALVLGTSECGMGLGPGEAIIKLADNGANKALIVAGYDFDSLRKAGFALRDYKNNDFKGSEYKLTSEQAGGEAIQPSSPVSEIKFVAGCDGCLVAQTCLKKGDKVFGNYCDGSQMQEFKVNGEKCSENYECISENCIDMKCSKKSLFRTIIEWIKGIFKA